VMHKEIEATSTRIMENAEVCKNIVKSYSTYYKTADNAWKKSPTANELISAFSDIKAKQATFEGCIEQYKSVSANDKEILSKEKELKNIVKIYSSYLKECEKTWAVTAEPDAIKEGLGKTLSIQAAIQAAVTGGNASVLDKKVKESKCKDMEALLQVIK
ncbi:MAG: hypothetical protein II165_07345, partial [Bacteroidales bacterium]|nr:hypothetical protein [Bacteroidales bacterium]